MSSYTGSIADALTAALSTAAQNNAFVVSFTPVRSFVPEQDYSKITSLQVHVFARGVEREQETRRSVRKDLEIAIAIAVRIDQLTDPSSSQSNALLDPYLELSEQIADWIVLNGPYANAPCLRVETDPIFDFALLRAHRVFASLHRAFFMRT